MDRLTADPFATFPARAYLEKYYARMGPENDALLTAITSFAHQLQPDFRRVIEVGGGPHVLPLLALTAASERAPEQVVFSDVATENLDEVRLWLAGHPDQFDYAAVLTWLRGALGAEPEPLVEALRSTNWDLRRLDMREPLPRGFEGRFDTVSSHFFAESATDDEDEFLAFLDGLRRLAAPGATLFLSFMCQSSGYAIAGQGFPAMAIDPGALPDWLGRAGISMVRPLRRYVPTEVDPRDSGYTGLAFLAGVLRQR